MTKFKCASDECRCKKAYYADQDSTNNTNLAQSFPKQVRNTLISRNKPVKSNGELYNPDDFAKPTNKLKSLGSGPQRFTTIQVSFILRNINGLNNEMNRKNQTRAA